jgi:hypothetical protein
LDRIPSVWTAVQVGPSAVVRFERVGPRRV